MSTPVIIVLVVLALAAVLLLGKRKGKSHAPPPATGGSGWVFGGNTVGMPARPTPQGAGWRFAFPAAGGHVNYVQWKDAPPLVGVHALVLRFAVTGGGFVPAEQPGEVARVGVCLQRTGDDWSAQGPMAGFRWYTRSLVPLVAGEYTITVPLDLDHLADVYGHSVDAAGLDATLRELDNLALVFGHGAGAGHGVYATEPSTFTLLAAPELVRDPLP